MPEPKRVEQPKPALLVLEDGSVFAGKSCGAEGEVCAEIVFNTAMTGYEEILTDPSYTGQIITMTFPHIGICGTNLKDMESRGVFASGLVVRSLSHSASNWRSQQTISEFLAHHRIVAIEGVDTRRLTRHVRQGGAMRAVLSTLNTPVESLKAMAAAAPSIIGTDLVSRVATTQSYTWGSEFPSGWSRSADMGALTAEGRYHVVLVDSGLKYNIARSCARIGARVTVMPPTASPSDVLALSPDGVLFPNGPGDPAAVGYLSETLRHLLGVRPVFGICLGHQMLSLALGATTFKLKYGHHGANHPVKNLVTNTVEVTSQNHGFCVDFASFGPLVPESSGGFNFDPGDCAAWVRAKTAPVVHSPAWGRVQLTHVNLNDMTVAGIRALDVPAFSVQYHPEAAPGPHDAHYLFNAFAQLMESYVCARSIVDGE